MSNDLIRAVERFCADFGITKYSFGRTVGGHPLVLVHHNGSCASVVYPTAGDPARAGKNVCARLRAQLGLRGANPRPKASAPARRPNTAGRAARTVPKVTATTSARPREDYRDVLARLLHQEGA